MKAIALISGGLDSILAARLIKDQGVEIIPLNFKMSFSCSGKRPNLEIDRFNLVKDALGAGLITIDISEDFLKMLLNPRYGFGSNMNPCIDCKILMLDKARELMPQYQAEFVVTGEVLGQRPMSQHKQALSNIERNSGLDGLLLRPLCARLLPESVPEKQGWVNRQKLLDFNGRGRRQQMALAKSFNIVGYQNPGGGCLLTDLGFSNRLKDLITHHELDFNSIELCKIGRHFRLNPETKLIVGRSQEENNDLAKLAIDGDYLFMPGVDLAGPTSLARGVIDDELFRLSCNITCCFCDLDGKIKAELSYRRIPDPDFKAVEAVPANKEESAKFRI